MRYIRVALICVILCAHGYAADKTTDEKSLVANPNKKLAQIAENTVVDLGVFTFERPKAEPQQGGITDYSGMVYDQHNHRILLFGGGHAATWSDSIYTFDFTSLKWEALYAPTPHEMYTKENLDRSFWKKGPTGNYPRPIGRHSYDLLVVPDDRKELLMLRTGTGPSMAADGFGYEAGAGGSYDFATDQWKIIDSADIGFGGYGAVAEYDPISKLVIGIYLQNIYAFDPVTQKSQLILSDVFGEGVGNGYSGCLVYYPPDKKMYIFTMESLDVSVLELNREDLTKSSVHRLEGTGGQEQYPKAEISFVYDSKNELIGGGVANNTFYAFDPKTKTWASQQIQGGKPDKMIFHCIVYSEIDNAYIFIGRNPDDQWGKKTWAYRWK